MPVSRPLLVVLVGAVLALAAFFATSGARNSEDAGSEVAAPATEPAKGKAAKSEADGSPRQVDSRASESAARAGAERGPGSGSDAKEDGAKVPADVARALARDRTVVLFFRQSGSADDDATARAVSTVRGRRGVAVFTAPISRLDDFAAITGNISISQAPAVVIVGRQNKARLIEGFIDEETLAQEVSDSR